MPNNHPAEEGFASLSLSSPLSHHEGEQIAVPKDVYQHIEYQRWLFEDKPVLDEPFSLSDIHVDIDCSALRWHDLQRARVQENDDSLDDEEGTSLLATVVELIRDDSFRDAVVIQGPPGAGKTTFTLRLARELADQGLYPIRVALAELSFDATTPIAEALAAATRIDGTDRNDEIARQWCDATLFENSALFDQVTELDGVSMCPYVLILDGWDQFCASATSGYQHQVNQLLHSIRARFLESRSAPVRVILTGRSIAAVEWSGFLRPETAVLTIHPLSPNQLEDFLENIRTAVLEDADQVPEHWAELESSVDVFTLIDRYEKDYDQAMDKLDWGELGQLNQGCLEVLGRPLPAYLALRLLAQWRGEFGPVLFDATTMYRSLFDLSLRALSVLESDIGPEGTSGDASLSACHSQPWRCYLRLIAEAMTLLGKERLSYQEFRVWLTTQRGGTDNTIPEQRLPETLVNSPFLKIEARDDSCEFTHASFREYLFAEQIVELLKVYGRHVSTSGPERLDEYWRDFEPGDPRRDLCHELARLLGPQWMSPGTATYVAGLIAWEVARAHAPHVYPTIAGQNAPLDMDGWIRIRDALADSWAWWAEGVHLRPQQLEQPDSNALAAPQVLDVIEKMASRPLHKGSFRPVRVVTVDARLGDGLFRLAALVHGEVARQQGFFDEVAQRDKYDEVDSDGSVRRYQRAIVLEDKRWILFDPAGEERCFLYTYCARINAAGYRPAGQFPAIAPLFGTFLAGVELFGLDMRKTDLRGAFLREVRLRHVDLRGADLSHANLRGAYLRHVDLRGARFHRSDLRHADLGSVDLISVNLRDSDLRNADLRSAKLHGAYLSGAKLNHANLRGANLRGADLSQANLGGADLGRTNLENANLSRANLRGATVSRQQLDCAFLEGAAGLDQIVER